MLYLFIYKSVVSAGPGCRQSFMSWDHLYHALIAHSIKSALRTFWLKLWPIHPPLCWFQKKPTHPLPYYSQLSGAKVG